MTEVHVVDLRQNVVMNHEAEHRAMQRVLEAIYTYQGSTDLDIMLLVGCSIDYFQGIACDHVYTKEVHNQLEEIRLQMQPIVLEEFLKKKIVN